MTLSACHSGVPSSKTLLLLFFSENFQVKLRNWNYARINHCLLFKKKVAPRASRGWLVVCPKDYMDGGSIQPVHSDHITIHRVHYRPVRQHPDRSN